MTRLKSLIKEVLSTPPKKKDCNCGCGGCEKKSPIITEGRIKKAISEGLTYHVENKIPLHESVYRIGSEKHFELINEARKLWVRGLIDVSEDDQAILETHLGNFGMYEGEKVPLDLPMVNEEKESVNEDKKTVDLYIKKWNDKMKGSSKSTAKDWVEGIKGISKEDKESILKGIKESVNEDQEKKYKKGDKLKLKLKNGKEFEVTFDSYSKTDGIGYMKYIDKDGDPVRGTFSLNSIISEGQDKWVVYDTKTKKRLPNAGKIYKDRKAAQAFADKQENAKVASDTFYFDKIQEKESVDEAIVDYDFSKEELIRVIKQLKRGASTEIGMIKAFEKALGRELTDDEIRGFKLNEAKKKKAKKKKKDPPLNKPKRGGSKAYYVYVRDPKTKKIVKVSFGSGGLRAKIKDKEKRNAFAARHNCKNKKDRTSPGYWSCNLPRYADQLGLGSKMNTFW